MNIKFLKYILFIFALLLISNVHAEEVIKKDAESFALEYFSVIQNMDNKTVMSANSVQYQNQTVYYEIRFEEGGWAIIAADDKAQPIIAYSLEGDLPDASTYPDHISSWMNGYKKQMVSIIEDNTLTTDPDWRDDGETLQLKTTATEVDPLISVKWNQGSGFNQYCPEDEDGPGGHAYVGCVAVAMAQAMYVSRYPTSPQGKKTYFHSTYGTLTVNYDNQPDYDWENMSIKSGDTENARLLYHCGVAVEMQYGASGSGAYTSNVAGALKAFFDFSADCKFISRYDDDDEWVALLNEELDKGRPIIYAGDANDGTSGHCFNIDGYDQSGLYHVNWGWGGSNNGYFTINLLKDGNYDYTQNQEIVLGVGEPYMGPTAISFSNSDVIYGTEADVFVAKISITDNSDEDAFTYTLKGEAKFPSGYLDPAFYVRNDSLFTSQKITRAVGKTYKLTVTVTDLEGLSYNETFTFNVVTETNTKSILDDSFKVYPNPASSYININRSGQQNSTLQLINLAGQTVLNTTFNSTLKILDVSHLNDGIYYLILTDSNQKKQIQKVIIR